MWRNGTGPEYFHIGSRVLIPLDSAIKWESELRNHNKHSTKNNNINGGNTND